jgi:hypothetical protein
MTLTSYPGLSTNYGLTQFYTIPVVLGSCYSPQHPGA